MAALHSALQSLGPVDFSDVPTDTLQLDTYLTDLFTQSELILESIPIPAPANQDPHQPHVASDASEIVPSVERSQAPAPEHAALQKEWGKPVKLGAKENPLSMSVYKLSGKDSRGAWFARRSVHEGIGFARFKEGLQMEFEQSLAAEGPAGTGNVRGIGGETRVESIDAPGKGKVEVYRLSAQFPGPTTPRDFVTLLVTSDEAMGVNGQGGKDVSGLTPRHYMIISKPCNHPETQPQSGFIRGSYESVEFIREVPRKLKSSMSTVELAESGQHATDSVGKEAIIRNAQQKTLDPAGSEGVPKARSATDLPDATGSISKSEYNPEHNPVEWIMVTRSDPGGSVPRFMVERGTPGSICADAKKFLDWACRRETDESPQETNTPNARPKVLADRRDSYKSWRGSRVAGLDEQEAKEPQDNVANLTAGRDLTTEPVSTEQNGYTGMLGAVTSTLSAFTPQAVLDHLPNRNAAASPSTTSGHEQKENISSLDHELSDDTASVKTTTSFASAEDHISSDNSENDTLASSKASTERTVQTSKHEIELQKLEERRAQLTNKFAESRTKLEQQASDKTAKDEAAHQKALKKHEKELAKHEEKYQKEFKKLEQKQEKERKKLEEKQRKEADKDDKTRLTRERDEARQELEIAKKEADVLRAAVADLQKENTSLVAQLSKTTMHTDLKGDADSMSRSSTLRKAPDSPNASLKSTFS